MIRRRRQILGRLEIMKQLMLVGLGGALGAVAGWKLSGAVLHQTVDWRFPLSTFVVNVAGCAIAGVLAGLVTKLDLFAAETRLFLFTGLLGGFTTFSAFGVEIVYRPSFALEGIAPCGECDVCLLHAHAWQIAGRCERAND